MALRDQPYMPFYVQDFMTDEKVSQCSASTIGVYIFIMCIMHKSENYGQILLKQKFKQTDKQIKNFASQLIKHMPFDFHTVANALVELIEERILSMENDVLTQKRMVKDSEISELRSAAGKKGGERTQFKKGEKVKNFALNFAKAKSEANSEYEYEYENEYKKKKRGVGEKKKKFEPPELEIFKKYWFDNGYNPEVAVRAWSGYSEANWVDSHGKQIINWKQKCQHVWFKNENKIQNGTNRQSNAEVGKSIIFDKL